MAGASESLRLAIRHWVASCTLTKSGSLSAISCAMVAMRSGGLVAWTLLMVSKRGSLNGLEVAAEQGGCDFLVVGAFVEVVGHDPNRTMTAIFSQDKGGMDR
jgi:hypothetical protein